MYWQRRGPYGKTLLNRVATKPSRNTRPFLPFCSTWNAEKPVCVKDSKSTVDQLDFKELSGKLASRLNAVMLHKYSDLAVQCNGAQILVAGPIGRILLPLLQGFGGAVHSSFSCLADCRNSCVKSRSVTADQSRDARCHWADSHLFDARMLRHRVPQ